MSYLKKWQQICFDHAEPVKETKEKVFNVIRCTLPASHETPVFFGLSEHQAKNLVFRVLKAREIHTNHGSRALYYDWKEII